MHLKRVRRIIKAFSDDTRLRIVNLLNNKELTVTEICRILNKNQSNVSKHLASLRLTGVVGDRRKGANVYYHLLEPQDRQHKGLLKAVTTNLSDLKDFKEDLKRLKEFREKSQGK